MPVCSKIGYTTRTAKQRLDEIYNITMPGKPPYRILLEESAMRSDGTAFYDREVHRYLRTQGVRNEAGEWFKCTRILSKQPPSPSKIDAERGKTARWISKCVRSSRQRWKRRRRISKDTRRRTQSRRISVEREDAIRKDIRRLSTRNENALAKGTGADVQTCGRRVAWEEDLKRHVDFKDWQFISPGGLSHEAANKNKPFVCFGSFQDYLGRNPSTGGIKTKKRMGARYALGLRHSGRYHYGAWREKAKDLFRCGKMKAKSSSPLVRPPSS